MALAILWTLVISVFLYEAYLDFKRQKRYNMSNKELCETKSKPIDFILSIITIALTIPIIYIGGFWISTLMALMFSVYAAENTFGYIRRLRKPNPEEVQKSEN